MKQRILPSANEIIFAISESPLGVGQEARVYKVHTNPDYTVRVSLDAPEFETLSKIIFTTPFVIQKDIFSGRNYAQSVAYLPSGSSNDIRPFITINSYVPGFSMEIEKYGRERPSTSEALMKTLTLSEAVLDMPDSAIDKLFDDLHFLSSREYSIDVGNGGLYTNTGNILYSAVDKEFRIIDIQPFLREHVGIPQDHTKGFNTPLFLTRGLIPGSYHYATEHSKYPRLIGYRTEIVNKIINGAMRNNLNDIGGYLRGDIYTMSKYWVFQLEKMHIPEKYAENFIKNISSVKQERRYHLIKKTPLVRVCGYDI